MGCNKYLKISEIPRTTWFLCLSSKIADLCQFDQFIINNKMTLEYHNAKLS